MSNSSHDLLCVRTYSHCYCDTLAVDLGISRLFTSALMFRSPKNNVSTTDPAE